mmetsp:Transcript_87823/g.248902  ORF Transcript_87823/g.248902 Transcript_87823/m.248902 type:complete len:236 (+) Transcript_87823:125-832(+)
MRAHRPLHLQQRLLPLGLACSFATAPPTPVALRRPSALAQGRRLQQQLPGGRGGATSGAANPLGTMNSTLATPAPPAPGPAPAAGHRAARAPWAERTCTESSEARRHRFVGSPARVGRENVVQMCSQNLRISRARSRPPPEWPAPPWSQKSWLRIRCSSGLGPCIARRAPYPTSFVWPLSPMRSSIMAWKASAAPSPADPTSSAARSGSSCITEYLMPALLRVSSPNGCRPTSRS